MNEVMYVPFHVHSMLSNGVTNIDSITNFREYVQAAKDCGMPAFGISEHGSCFEWVHKKEAIEAAGMKYIHAVEAYLTEDDNTKFIYKAVDLFRSTLVNRKKDVEVHFTEWDFTEDGKCVVESLEDSKCVWIDPETIEKYKPLRNRDNYHCILIAKNLDGVREINKMVSRSFCREDEHFYYMPRMTFDELFATSDNVIVTTACLGGVLHNGNPAIKERMLGFLTQNKHRCYLEIQHHNCKEQIEYNQFLYEVSQSTGIPLIVGTDTHALNKDHLLGRSIMQKAKTVSFENEDDWDLTFKTPEQLVEAYKIQDSLPMSVVLEAMQNTIMMADSIEPFEIDRSPKYPKLYDDSEGVFKQKINEGVISRGVNKYPNYNEYVDRIHYEYDTYKHNGAIDFMLLEENYKSEMRRRGIRFGYSRGSVSGSIIAYLLGITEIDSIKYNLNFDRFMNKERISLADVDTDWFSEDRDTVKDYLHQKDGLYCCDIVTFNTIALKGAVKDVCRGLHYDNLAHLPGDVKDEVKKWDKMNADRTKDNGPGCVINDLPYPPELAKKIKKYSIHSVPLDYLNFAEKIISIAEEDESKAREEYKEIFWFVDLVNGCVVSVGNHPAGCVVSPYPVDEWFGTFTTKEDKYPISLLNMKEIDSLNFVKLDILGLDNVGLIYKTCDLAGIPYLTPDNTPADDINVWNSIREDTTLIFQWESPSATAYLKQLFSDETIARIKEKNPDFSYMNLLSIGNGAIRPAGESYRDKLSRGIYESHDNEELDEFMKSTLGYMVYQCQIIEFLNKFCGYSMGEADVVRRCMAEDSMILMSDGRIKPIQSINVGDKVISLDEHGLCKPDVVNKVYYNGEQDTYEISATHGYKIVATANHKILTQRGWVEVQDLTIDDCVMTPSSFISDKDNMRPNQRLTMDEMLLIGMLIGDGTLGGDSVSFTNSDITLIDEFQRCVKSRSASPENIEFIIRSQDGVEVDKVYNIYIKTKYAKKSLDNLISKLGLNVKSAQKHIPNSFMLYPPSEKLRCLLAGLFSTDGGYVSQSNSIEYYTTSKSLAQDVKHLLLKFGIYSYVSSYPVKGYKCISYKVRISQKDALLNFEKYILPYMVGNKIYEFKDIFEKNKTIRGVYNYLLPKECKEEIFDMSEKTHTSINSIINTVGWENKSLPSIHKAEVGISDVKAMKFIQHIYCPKTYELLMKKYIPMRIRSIKSAGKRKVYDLEITNNHNYVANDIIVHNCFAKKTGTADHLPKIKANFIQTMEEKYNVTAEESEKIIVNFLQVIEDASDYLFSKNHADPYSWIGYVCGYLRYYYPIEFLTVALNIFQGKEDKSLAITEYAKKRGFKISPIKFRYSVAEYGFDKQTKQIFKGIASIKFMNTAVADELYALRDNQYNSFMELLFDISDKTTLNARQIKILIDLDFFSEFGDANYLMAQYRMFDKLNGKKQFKKEDIEKLGIPLEIVRRFSGKETAKLFKEIDINSILINIAGEIQYTKRSLKERISSQIEHLGYVDVVGEEYKGMGALLDINTKYTPKAKVYSLKNGSNVECKIDKRFYNRNKIERGDIIKITETKKKQKMRKSDDGGFEPIPGVMELWITKYTIINNI